MRNKDKTHCKVGHPLSGDNMRLDTNGARVCRTCKSAFDLAWRQENPDRVRATRRKHCIADRRAGITRLGFRKQRVEKIVTRDLLEKAFEVVRETGMLKSAFDIVPVFAMKAFWYFNPKVHVVMRKLRLEAKRPIIAAPAIALRDPAVVARVMERIDIAVPRYLQRDHRDDVISDMTTAWLERRLRADDVEARTKEFVNARFKSDHNKWGDISLDVPLSIDGTVTLGDILPEDRRLWSPS